MFSVFRRNIEEPVSGCTFSVSRTAVAAVEGPDTFLAVKAVQPLAVTVILDADGGSCPAESISTYVGEKVGSLPTCTRSDHRFVKWVDMKGREVTEKSVVTSDLFVLTAVYSEPVNIVLNYGDGVQGDAPSTVKAWPGFEIGPLPSPQGPADRPNFISWSTESGEVVTETTVFDGSFTSLTASYSNSFYEVGLSGGWFKNNGSSVDPNGKSCYQNSCPDGYDGVYTSFGNLGVGSSTCILKISVVGYTKFRILCGSNSETNYDYAIAMVLDEDPSRFSSSELRSGQKYDSATGSYIIVPILASNKSSAHNDGSNPSTYFEAEYQLDGGSHDIYVVYIKDGSVNYGDDRGYVLIPRQ